MSSISHASQLFLLALASLIGYCVLAAIGVQNPGLFDLLKEVVLASIVGGSVAVPGRAAADVTVSGPVNVDTSPSPLHPDTVTTPVDL